MQQVEGDLEKFKTGDDVTTESKETRSAGGEQTDQPASPPTNHEGAKTAVLLDMGPLEETMPEVAPAPQSPGSGSAAAAAAAAAVNRKRPSNEVVSEGSSRRRPSVVAEDKTSAAAAAASQQSAQCQCRPPPPSSWFSSSLVRHGVFALLLLFLIAAFAHIALHWCLR